MKKAGHTCYPPRVQGSLSETGPADDADIAQPAAEAVLAHKQGTAVERAYLTSDFFEHRLPIMDQWANFLTGTMGPIISTPPAVSGEEQPVSRRKRRRKGIRKGRQIHPCGPPRERPRSTVKTKKTFENEDNQRKPAMIGANTCMPGLGRLHDRGITRLQTHPKKSGVSTSCAVDNQAGVV